VASEEEALNDAELSAWLDYTNSKIYREFAKKLLESEMNA